MKFMVTSLKNEINSKELAQLAENLNNLMREKDIETKQLSALTGISASLLNSLKRGDGNPTLGTLISLANFFDVTIDALVLSDARKQEAMAVLPVYEIDVAHQYSKHNAVQNIYLKIEDEKNMPSYGIRLDNSSLMPFFEKGSIFLISSNNKYTDGDLVLVRINNEYNVFRKVFIKNKGLYFQFISLDTDLHTYDNYKIIGPVIKVIHNMKALNG